MSYRRLKQDSELNKKIQDLENYLEKNNLSIEISGNITRGLMITDTTIEMLLVAKKIIILVYLECLMMNLLYLMKMAIR